MNEPQRTAIQSPCRLAFETANPAFAWNLTDLHGASLVLTVNSGWE